MRIFSANKKPKKNQVKINIRRQRKIDSNNKNNTKDCKIIYVINVCESVEQQMLLQTAEPINETKMMMNHCLATRSAIAGLINRAAGNREPGLQNMLC